MGFLGGYLLSRSERRGAFGWRQAKQETSTVARCDIGYPWRIDWGGHDPATPMAEMFINYHNTTMIPMYMICVTVFYLCRT
mmetsp:Transcript_1455/g.2225  ORF Transcript_1455/g.2225 Transcript_1455/m.2225 type:complete len:81 (-) Transcript_1455:119-361(-)